MKVQIFIPCFVDQVYPQSAMHMVEVLERIGHEVQYDGRASCCGQPAFNAGYKEEAQKVCSHFVKNMDENLPIVVPSASCAGFLKTQAVELLKGSERARKVIGNIYEFTDFIVRFGNLDLLHSSYPHKVAYHSSCASLREYPLMGAPQAVLKRVAGLELITVRNFDTCCGFGGTFSVKFGAISSTMADDKLTTIKETGAHKVASTDLSCLLHISTYAQKHGYPLEVLHVADILAQQEVDTFV